ncbi:MAG: Hsp70 family protein [Nitrospirae bacterium]|nr:Hsp70 family protein [Nitrospirota bacterium]
MIAIGIDLGTSNTLVAAFDNGEPRIIEIEGNTMIPSVICIEETGGNTSIGKAALDMWAAGDDDDNIFRRWKLKMGEDHIITKFKPGGEKSDEYIITPEELTKLMVEYVVKQISDGYDGLQVESILVTVPHGWRREHPEKCRSTRIAAALAKLNGKPVNVQNLTVSEPVAAAAYWLWVTQKNIKSADFIGKTLLVCDVGGGTFDLSLVLVGDTDKPLDVIDAANNNYAGDYVDALLCASICTKFNQAFNTRYPSDADEILDKVTTGEIAWIRKWLETCKHDFKETLTLRIEQTINRNKPTEEVKAVTESFDDPDGNHLQVKMNAEEFIACLEPFYAHGSDLVGTFLGRISSDKRPYAVVFAGGGSRIYGVRDNIVKPVIEALFSPEEMQKVLTRIKPNKGKMEHAIVLGAALIANGVVTVQERILHDIGIVFDIDERFAKGLGLPVNTGKILLSPVIKSGCPLPAIAKSSDYGLPLTLLPGEVINIQVVIDDDSSAPWIQTWEVSHTGAKKEQSVEWVAEADSDGALNLRFRSSKGHEIKIQGKLERRKTGKASIVIGRTAGEKASPYTRMTPEKLCEAWERIGRKAWHTMS